MAWNIHWQCCFQSLDGTSYAVNIYDENYLGGIVQLTGAAEPFVTQEDDNDDIFTPIRIQTGYIRIIDPNGALLETLVPANNTQRLVRLVTGTYSGGVFSQGVGNSSVKWQGFLQAQAYTQPWDGNACVVELPVKSLLGALEDVQLPDSVAMTEANVASLIKSGFESFMGGDVPFTDVKLISDINTAWLDIYLQLQLFLSEETVNNQGDSFVQLVGRTYFQAIGSVLAFLGMTGREDGNTLCFAHYDNPAGSQCIISSLTWQSIINIANGQGYIAQEETFWPTDLLSSIEFLGTDNTRGFLQGGRSAKVSLQFQPLKETLMSLPLATEDNTPPNEIDKVANATVRVQLHPRGSGNGETFTYTYYADFRHDTGTASSYNNCVDWSVINQPILPNVADDPSYVTGAYPVRFSANYPDDSSQKFLTNGLMVNLTYTTDYDDPIRANAVAVYSITSQWSLSYAKGYLNIDMAISCFAENESRLSVRKLEFGTIGYSWPRRYKMFLKLNWGSKYWNGEEWTTDSTSTFVVETDGQRIITNQSEDIFSDKSDGFFIPVTESMSGLVTLTIMNQGNFKVERPDVDRERRVNSSIISNLSVSYLAPIGVTASDRNENVYRQTIIQSGFSEDKEIILSVGTMNNNIESLAFVKYDNSSYVENMTYHTGLSTTMAQRPELHLLDRMVVHYSAMRRTLQSVIGICADMLVTRFRNNDHDYMGVHRQVNWRDDTEVAYFIEV